MPNLTGDELAQEIMKIGPDAPIILCTGFSEKMSAEKATEPGIKLFLLKPLSNMVLAQSIRKVLDKKQSGTGVLLFQLSHILKKIPTFLESENIYFFLG